MNRADLNLLDNLLDNPPECAHASLTRLIAEHRLALDAKDITAGKLVKITVQKGRGDEDSPFVHEQLLARPVGDHFAIHKEESGWTVTHRPSGLSATKARRGATLAAAIATAIQRVKGIDWSKKEPLKGVDHDVSKFAGKLGMARDLATLTDTEKQCPGCSE